MTISDSVMNIPQKGVASKMKQYIHFNNGVCYSPELEEPFGEGYLLNYKDSCPHYIPTTSIKVKYKNWKGEVGIRNIIPQNIYYGNTEFHPEDQWLLDVFDVDKDAQRTYAMMDIIEFIKE